MDACVFVWQKQEVIFTWLMTSCIDCSRMPRACSGLQESNRKTFLSCLSEAWMGSWNREHRNEDASCDGQLKNDQYLLTDFSLGDRVWFVHLCWAHLVDRCWTSNQSQLAAASSRSDHGRGEMGRRWRAAWSGLSLVAPNCTELNAPHDLWDETYAWKVHLYTFENKR